MSPNFVSLGKNIAFGILAAVPLAFAPAVQAGPVDINHADAATIAKELQGIGPSRAKAIVTYREKNGAFKSVDELRNVKGVGAKNCGWIRLLALPVRVTPPRLRARYLSPRSGPFPGDQHGF